jgi:hypothetical protein
VSNIQDLRESNELSDDSEHIAVIEIVEPKKEYPIGTTAELIVNVRCPEGCDLGGGLIFIGDENDQVIAEQYLTSFENGNGINTTGPFGAQIPTEPGEYTWTIVFFPEGSADEAGEGEPAAEGESAAGVESATDTEGGPAAGLEEATEGDTESSAAAVLVGHAIIQAEYRFKANKHITGMTVHRAYQPVETGADYVITVGAECLTGCSLLGQKVNVFCEDELLATAELKEPVGTSTKLYQAAITLTAPDSVGLYELRCRVDPEGLGLAHTSNECKHYVTTRLPAQCRLEVSVVDAESSKPVADVSLTVRPTGGYPSWWQTNSEGKAFVEVAWGEYTVSTNRENYGDVTESVILPEGQELIELTIPVEYHEPAIM